MIQLIFLTILLLPIIAVCKILSKPLGIPTLTLTMYFITWLICSFLYFLEDINSWIVVLVIPFFSHICMIIVYKIFKWTVNTITNS